MINFDSDWIGHRRKKPSMSTSKVTRISGLVATVSLNGGVLADVCTFYTVKIQSFDAAMPLLGLENLRPSILQKPARHIDLGHYLALFLIPLGMAGLYHIYRALRSIEFYQAEITVALGILGFCTGMAFHFSFGYVTALLQAAPTADQLPRILSRNEPFVVTTAIASVASMVLSFGILLVVTAMGRTAYPRWFVVVNPIPVQLTFNTVAFSLPVKLGSLLAITSLNSSLLLFFDASTIVFWNGFPDESVGFTT